MTDKELLEKAMELIGRGVLLENYATNEEMFELKDWKKEVQESLGHLNPEYRRVML